MLRTTLRLGLASLALVGLTACAGAPATETAEPQTLAVTVSGMRFQPDTLTLVAGQPVRLTLTNNDALEHDFSITAFPLDGEVQTDGHGGHEMVDGPMPDLHVGTAANGNGTITFTPSAASAAGTYEFYCTVPGHKAAGMVGSLVVTAP